MLTQELVIPIDTAEVDRALAFYIQAFGSDEVVEIEHAGSRFDGDGEGTTHAELHIGSVVIAFVPPSGAVHRGSVDSLVVLNVEDARIAARAAWDAGATIVEENLDGVDAELACHVRDPFGREWLLRERRTRR